MLCIRDVRDRSNYGLMQRNSTDECLRKLTAGVNNHILHEAWLDPSLEAFSSKFTGMICQLTGEAGGICVIVAFGDDGCFLQFLQDKGGFKITM